MTAMTNITMYTINILNFGHNQDDRVRGVCISEDSVHDNTEKVAMSKYDMFHSRSALYTSGRFLCSLLSLFSFR